ncbi:hypothetical protein NDU88_005998 [Pleurodeles waltl]|uniref:Uncharacterized protein n=1 Tax=Pleurodeles waltl TaxID=8319 RepID=A0AAV7MGB2_PLEWA|nr:hypothetical protein NDU88_005998 [Pleurodeles waltl]
MSSPQWSPGALRFSALLLVLPLEVICNALCLTPADRAGKGGEGPNQRKQHRSPPPRVAAAGSAQSDRAARPFRSTNLRVSTAENTPARGRQSQLAALMRSGARQQGGFLPLPQHPVSGSARSRCHRASPIPGPRCRRHGAPVCKPAVEIGPRPRPGLPQGAVQSH